VIAVQLSNSFYNSEILSQVIHADSCSYLCFDEYEFSYSYILPFSEYVCRKVNYLNDGFFKFSNFKKDKYIVTNADYQIIDELSFYGRLTNADIISGKYFIESERNGRRKPSYIKTYIDENKDPVAIKEFKFERAMNDSKDIIFLSMFDLKITKMDVFLNIKWQREFTHDHIQGSVKRELLDYKETVITNLGIADRDKKEDGEVVALLKETGETKWSFKYNAPIHSCQLIKDRIYLTSFNQWIILDANSGEVILEGESGFELENDEAVGANLWSDGEFLFFSSVWGSKIRIYHESTGKFHGDINCPEGFSISARPPVSLNGYHYFDLSSDPDLIACYHGVLITSTEEVRKGAPFNIEIEKNENFTIEAVDQGNGQAYDIHFNESVLGHILRFGRIEAQKIAFSNTYNMLASLSDDYGKHINKLFNGQIIFKIKQSVLEQPLEEKLDLMCNLIETHCEKYTAPHAKEKVKVSWQWS
jgi:hypothetical protein